ncbi:MAG: hypothetical protein JAY90_19715 [Candidatus Thiodiazotropha lotti]|nr:hypothetical protein [Candidatus Thiodiazotropha lotti]
MDMTLVSKFSLIYVLSITSLLVLTNGSYWIVGAALFLFSWSIGSCVATYLLKRKLLTESSLETESVRYSRVIVTGIGVCFILAHLFELPAHLELPENLWLVLFHALTLIFTYHLVRFMFKLFFRKYADRYEKPDH